MYAVCIIPVDSEVFCRRLQIRKAEYCLVRVCDSLRIGIFRHAPDTFYCRILIYIFLYQIHIRSRRRHRDVDHLDSEVLCNTKVSVISRYRAEEFYFVELAPRCASEYSVCHCSCNCIIHNVQTGISEDDYIIFRHFHHIRKKLFCLGDSVQPAVVPAVNSVLTGQVGTAVQYIHHLHGQVELFCGRLSAGHIQFQALGLDLCKTGLQPTLQFQ